MSIVREGVINIVIYSDKSFRHSVWVVMIDNVDFNDELWKFGPMHVAQFNLHEHKFYYLSTTTAARALWDVMDVVTSSLQR